MSEPLVEDLVIAERQKLREERDQARAEIERLQATLRAIRATIPYGSQDDAAIITIKRYIASALEPSS